MLAEAKEMAYHDQLIDVILQASPKIKSPGTRIEIESIEKTMEQFQQKLQEPLDMEQRRAKVLELVRNA